MNVETIMLFLNQGVAIAVCCYFMWLNNTTIKDMKSAIEKLTEAINKMEAVHKKEDDIHLEKS